MRFEPISFLLAGAVCISPYPAWSQAYPARAVRMIVPFSAGGPTDLTARLLGTKMSEGLGQPVVVDNRAGASGAIGAGAVAKSKPDGYTTLLSPLALHLSAFFLVKDLPYHPINDFSPITNVLDTIGGVVVSASVPAASLRELIELLKRNPGKFTYGTGPVGTEFHLIGELFKQAAGTDIVHVPYKGVGPALNDLIGGQISMMFSVLSTVSPQLSSGKIRLLAVVGTGRYSALPDIPNVIEIVPNFRKLEGGLGLFAPAGMTRPVVQRLHAEVAKAINTPEVRSNFQEAGATAIANSPEEFAATLLPALEGYGRALKLVGMKPE
jgi:tripartite-type tricarboxylate transporter receptor subunit TctC